MINIKELSNNDLAKLLAHQTRNEKAWQEFYFRFHKHICCIVSREYKRRGSDHGNLYVEDIAQDIYRIILQDDCKALRGFKGRWENSIYKYLEVISIRVVLRELSNRQPMSAWQNISWNAENCEKNMLDLLPWEGSGMELKVNELIEEIELCLDQILVHKRDGNTHKLIFRYYLYEDMGPGVISEHLGNELSSKTVSNILSDIKNDLRKCLNDRKKNDKS